MLKLVEQLKFSGNVIIEVRSAKTAKLLDTYRRSNLVVTVGRNLVRDLLNGDTTAYLTHLGVGTSSTAVNAAQTALVAQVLRDQITQRVSTADGQLRLKYYLASTSANGNTLQEAGLFNAATSGTMFARVVHTAIAKTSSISISYDWTINIGAS